MGLIKKIVKLIKRHKHLLSFFGIFLKHSQSKRFKQKKIKALSYNLTVADAPSFVWQFKEIFSDEIYKFECEKENPVIFDLGANIGMSVLYFKSIFPKAKIKAYEADSEIASILSSNLKNNGINDVEIVEKAAWINNDGVTFNKEGADGGSLFSSDKEQVLIPSVRLKDEIEKEEKIDMLKMDVEGAETEIFKDLGKSISKAENVFIEYHSFSGKEQELDEILAILKNASFRYYIKPVTALRLKPFVEKKIDSEMDLQLNIFAWKES